MTPAGVATSESNAICFERAVVHRRGLVGMDAKVKRELFDTVRCKVRKYCRISVKDEVHRDRLANNSNNTLPAVRVTLVTRKGDRAFQNATAVAAVVQRECAMVGACRLKIVSFNVLSFCEQVRAHSANLEVPYSIGFSFYTLLTVSFRNLRRRFFSFKTYSYKFLHLIVVCICFRASPFSLTHSSANSD